MRPDSSASRTRRRAVAPRAVVLAALLACGEEPAGIDPRADPVPGVLAARLISPHDAEGAVLVELVGGEASAIEAPSASVLSHQRGGSLYVLVARFVPGEIGFTITVPDTASPPVARILQVADGASRLRASLTGYALELRP